MKKRFSRSVRGRGICRPVLRFVIAALLLMLTFAGCGGQGRGASTGRADDADGRDADSSATGAWIAGERGERVPRAVEAVEIVSGPLVNQIEGAGRIAGTREATVVTQSPGVAQRVVFDLGSKVESGDLLATFDDRSERLAMEQARAQAESAAVELEAARRGIDAGTASAVELSRAQAAASGAEAAYRRAFTTWEDRSLRAPISGRIASKDPRVTEGNFVPAGTAIARLVDTSILQMEVPVGEREIPYVAPGAAADIYIDVCGQEPQRGHVRSVAAGSDPSTGSFPVIVEWPNRCGDVIRSGMSASVRIDPTTDTQVLLIPTAALLRRQDETFVFVVGNGTVSRRTVEVGLRLGNRAEVVLGLNAGELVAVSALTSLSDGDPVVATVLPASGTLR